MISTMPHRCSTYSICASGVAGFSTTPAIFAEIADMRQGAVQMDRRAGLAMDEQMIGAGLGEIVEIMLGLDDHQMDIDRFRRRLAHRLDDDRADRDVRHKAPVHHIDMDPVGAGAVDRAHLVGEPAEIGRQDRRGDDDRSGPSARASCGYGFSGRHCRPLRHSRLSAASGPALPAG